MFVLRCSFVMALSASLVSLHAVASIEDLTAHRDNYFLPFYKEQKVNQARFEALNPNDTPAKDTFIQFQISLKYRLLDLDNEGDSGRGGDGLYVAYTQRSNWEAYDSSAYFRDSDYNPELFYRLTFENWQTSIGFEHQSNGAGGDIEVSWNRAYIDVQYDFEHGFVRFKPWARVGSVDYNPDIDEFLGYGEVELGWLPTQNNEIKLLARNVFTQDFERGYYNLSWNFPIYQGLRGYVKAETGYGLTISNYNFRDSAYGLGVAFDL
ncbi:phospholipase [Enterovibrio norvegicus]|uniref:Phospholipase A1 n=2 Tax=Enterovibrio norvegicus TaxID=188144 RepID=A0A1I5JCG1_9GAMM|nr:phospholipase A [Enterovibrio norvegicus]OEF48510.1 phospholipase [Enterovibrio norvegicus]OEF56711.1 phospholipase [Enterovibrio norvegicus]SFO70046.1 phospholipase A1 [Enterovibrio norvegicus DSM 15893]